MLTLHGQYPPSSGRLHKMNYAAAISAKFCSFTDQYFDEVDLEPRASKHPSLQEDCGGVGEQSDTEDYMDNSIEKRLRPGVRDKQTASYLRIYYIEKKLKQC